MKVMLIIILTLVFILFIFFKKRKDEGENFKFGLINIFEGMLALIVYLILLSVIFVTVK